MPNFQQLIKDQIHPDIWIQSRHNDDLLTLCKKVWNLAIQTASEHGDCDCHIPHEIDYELAENVECAFSRASILKLKIDE